jgi:uncharacterized protein (DUF2336 family)
VDASQSLIAELEEAIDSGSKDRRVDALRRVTDLFVADADRLNDQQIDVFDDVLGHLIKRIEGKALAELSRRLGAVSNAPAEVVRSLAHDDNIATAEPVLAASPRLTDSDLIEIASTKTQAHLLAISARPQIATAVTDVLIQRGDRDVFHKLAGNAGAAFSEKGFETLVQQSERDEQLAEKIGQRLDVPLRLFRELLLRATEAVRSRLLMLAGPENRSQIQRILADITQDAQNEAGHLRQHDYAKAYERITAMRAAGNLNDAAIFEFAREGRHAEIAASLAILCGAPMPLLETLLDSDHREAILVPCKAARLEWPTVRAILNSRSVARTMSDLDDDAARADFFKLSESGAQRVMRFWQVRRAASNDAKPATDAARARPSILKPTASFERRDNEQQESRVKIQR